MAPTGDIAWNPERSWKSLWILPNDLRALCKPGVYIFWFGDVALYIGSSRRIISRISNPNHEHAPRALRECTRIEVRFFQNELVARDAEQELIFTLKPKYNIQRRKSSSVSMRKG